MKKAFDMFSLLQDLSYFKCCQSYSFLRQRMDTKEVTHLGRTKVTPKSGVCSLMFKTFILL